MELYVGGSFQGKLNYVLDKKSWKASSCLIQEWGADDMESRGAGNAADCLKQLVESRAVVHNHFHKLVALAIGQGKTLEEIVDAVEIFLEGHPEAVIICDEVGSGIVPEKQEQRIYREYVGRVLCVAAGKAGHMERIICGIGQVIK